MNIPFHKLKCSHNKVTISELYCYIINVAPRVAHFSTSLKKRHDAIQVNFCFSNIAKTSLQDESLGFESLWLITRYQHSPQLDISLKFVACKPRMFENQQLQAIC